MKTNTIIQGDALTRLKELPDKSINMLMTSPPYWALRDYGDSTSGTIWDGNETCEHEFISKDRKIHSGKTKSTPQASVDKVGGFMTDWKTTDHICNKCGAWKGQLGLEPTFDLYIKHLCDIFDEVKRVLRDDGTCWVNIGDTYNANNRGGGLNNCSEKQKGNKGTHDFMGKKSRDRCGLPQKSLTMIPQRFALEMVNRGWILRNTIIWHKPNCMPSSVKDRFTVDFEYIFFFTKKKKYYFEQQYEPFESNDHDKKRMEGPRKEYSGKSDHENYGSPRARTQRNSIPYTQRAFVDGNKQGRNKRAVWKISPKPFKESHFAVYPEELCETPIKAGCPNFVCVKCGNPKVKEFKRDVPTLEIHRNVRKGNRDRAIGGKYTKFMEENPLKEIIKPTCNCNEEFTNGIVLDPFFGAGTTGLVALKQGKKFLGIELNKEYIKIAEARLKPFLEQEKL